MEVNYIDHMGSDLSVVNAARVSFKKRSEWRFPEEKQPGDVPVNRGDAGIMYLPAADAKLIQYLARGCTTQQWNNLIARAMVDAEDYDEMAETLREARSMPRHWTPFGHVAVCLSIKAPFFVARQLFKHKMGAVENEVSRRYVTDDPEIWVPDAWRGAAKNKKQGSDGPIEDQRWAEEIYDVATKTAVESYRLLLNGGIAPEQARAVLPNGTYTEWWVNGSLFYWANVYLHRSREDAQIETKIVAEMIEDVVQPLFPVSWQALTEL